MKVSYRIEETDLGTVLSVFDDIDLANANMLADALFSAIEARRGLTVDLRGLRYIDSVGLHILLRAGQRAQRLGCELTLVAVRPTLQLIEQIGLNRMMTVVSEIPVLHVVRGPIAPADAPPRTGPRAAPASPPRPLRPTEPSKTES